MFGSKLRPVFSRSSAAAATAASTMIIAYGFSFDNRETVQCKSFDKKVVIVGGGTGGVGVAAMLRNQGVKNVTVIEPSQTHYYQPLWTLVGGGVYPNTKSQKPMKDVIPKGTNWIPKGVSTFDPKKNKVTLEDGEEVEYDYLVVAAGLKSDFTAVPGMKEGLEKKNSGVVSLYNYNYSQKVNTEFNEIVKDRLGKGMKTDLIFTMPTTTLKCAGAPQKIMWLLEDTLRNEGLRALANFQFIVPGASMFGVKHYADKLEKMRKERDVDAKFEHVLVALDVNGKVATFKDAKTNQVIKKPYDFIHVCPNMVPMDFVKNSPLADANGWVDVDNHTLQSTKYSNVFALGDCTNTPNSKTAAAITAQAPVLVHNLEREMEGQTLDGSYDGYASCPLVIGQKKLMMLEFMYGGQLKETFSMDTGKFPWKYIGTDGALQYRFFFFLKEQLFPYVYWNLWTRGWWYGTDGVLKPNVVQPKKEGVKQKA